MTFVLPDLVVLESAPDAVVIANAAGQIQHVTARMERLFGYSRAELIGGNAEMLISAVDGEGNSVPRGGLFSAPGARSTGAAVELTGRRKDGVEFPVEISVRPIESDGGLTTAAIRDVTDRKRFDQELGDANVQQLRVLNAELVQKINEFETLTAEQEARNQELSRSERETAESLALLETLQSTAPVGFGFVDREFRMRRMNAALAGVNGLPLEEQLDRTVAELAPAQWPRIEPIYRHVLETGEAVVNQEAQDEGPSAPGEIRHWLESYYPVWVKDEVVGVGLVAVDITARQQSDEFGAVVLQNMVQGLIVFDLAGRLTLMNAAAAKMTGWTEDELRGTSLHEAIHYQHADGSEFASEDCPLLSIQTEGRTVRAVEDAFTRKDGSIFPVVYSASPLHSGAAVSGVVITFRDTTEEESARNDARRELNALGWVGRIRDALDEDRFVLYSQPIVPLSTDATPREELLIRMIGQNGHVISPGSFLPVAEKYGQIWEIDKWVIRRAAQLASTGRRVHANLSAASIGNRGLLARIEQELIESGADPGDLVFEITETALMGDLDAGETFGREITDLGCSLALDDFGTGHGSFTYLQRLNIAYLKIDIQFVRDLVSNTVNQHLVKAIVNIAHGFGQQTVAEGVEDGETLALLLEYGVDLAQGFHLGRPQLLGSNAPGLAAGPA
jgi:PAS domain S-box-containing protein